MSGGAVGDLSRCVHNRLLMTETPVRVQSLVLAGGASRRMGIDKALISYHGEPQVRRLAAMMESVAGPAYVSVRRSQLDDPAFQGLRLLCDQAEDMGPLAGLLAAFAHEPGSAWLLRGPRLAFAGSRLDLRRMLTHRDSEKNVPLGNLRRPRGLGTLWTATK